MTATLAITGFNGFVGTHLARIAHAAGHRVVGIGRELEPSPYLAPHLGAYLFADLYKPWPVAEQVDVARRA